MKILDLSNISTWPLQILSHLEKHHKLYLNWETGINRPSADKFDAALYELMGIVRSSNYTMRGYHCTRLTKTEMQAITEKGMILPDLAMLNKRIEELESSGLITQSLSQHLKDNNQSDDDNRVGQIWFCFFPPHIGGQWGIERFFRSWGGEALYNSHERDPISGPALTKIGIPCIIEALVPLQSLHFYSYLEKKLIRRFLVSRGFKTSEELNHEDCAKQPIPPRNIIRIISFPDADFIYLTKCNQWEPQLN